MEFGVQYLSYDEYVKLGGDLSIMPFNLIEYECRKDIDEHTYGRLKNFQEQTMDVKLCLNALINEKILYNSTRGKSSESVGSYSVTFDKPDTKEEKQKKLSIIQKYLGESKLEDGTPYLYKG